MLMKRYIYSMAVGCGSLSSVIDGHSVVCEWEGGALYRQRHLETSSEVEEKGRKRKKKTNAKK